MQPWVRFSVPAYGSQQVTNTEQEVPLIPEHKLKGHKQPSQREGAGTQN